VGLCRAVAVLEMLQVRVEVCVHRSLPVVEGPAPPAPAPQRREGASGEVTGSAGRADRSALNVTWSAAGGRARRSASDMMAPWLKAAARSSFDAVTDKALAEGPPGVHLHVGGVGGG
jgi:hypothetical protein